VTRAASATAPASDAAAADDAGEKAQRTREGRDALVEKLRRDYAPRIARAEEKLRNAQQIVAREKEQAGAAKVQTAISVGATILDVLIGNKRVTRTGLGRATTAARGAGRAMQQEGDVKRAEEDARAAQADLDAINEELQKKIDAL
jgi:hypothetical protein